MPRLRRKDDGEWYVVRAATEREFPDDTEGRGERPCYTYQVDDVAEARLAGELGIKEDDRFPLSVFWELRENCHLYTRSEYDTRLTAFYVEEGMVPLWFSFLSPDMPPAAAPALRKLVFNELISRKLLTAGAKLLSFSEFEHRFGRPVRSAPDRDGVRSLYEDLKRLEAALIGLSS